MTHVAYDLKSEANMEGHQNCSLFTCQRGASPLVETMTPAHVIHELCKLFPDDCHHFFAVSPITNY